MRKTNYVLIMILLLLISCKHKETNSERYNRNIKAAIETLTKKVDSYTRTNGVRKTIFIIDTTDVKFKNLVRLDKATTIRILNGKMIMEDHFTSKIDSFNSELFFYGDLTKIFRDTTYIILQKENLIFDNIRLYLVRIKKDETQIKLLAAVENQSCMNTVTISALLGDSVIFTQQTSHAVSDVRVSNEKTYFIRTDRIKKFKLKDNLYISLDSSRITGYE